MSDTPRKELPQHATCLPWRVGTKVGRTIYSQDKLIGLMDKAEDAAFVVALVNHFNAQETERLLADFKGSDKGTP